jgi:16S rRNA (uracil1498-N3)-methyltransferase
MPERTPDMPDRFYVPDFSTDSETVRLEGPEAHHLLNVLRGAVGDRVEVFDGRGTSVLAQIIGTQRKAAELRVIEIVSSHAPPRRLTLATAVPKGERFRWLVEKATELGVATLQPLETARSVVAPRGGKLDKMRQAVVAACKQCGRNDLMAIREPLPWSDFLAGAEAAAETTALLICSLAGRPLGDVAESIGERPLIAAVGPEGGFTTEETAAAATAGATAVNLGPSILRTETAALALAAWATVALPR